MYNTPGDLVNYAKMIYFLSVNIRLLSLKIIYIYINKLFKILLKPVFQIRNILLNSKAPDTNCIKSISY